jgi:CubicO group peptidase (beta-lactamase class C family)
MKIGSVAKVFNATIVMPLVSEGVLDLDTSVNRYISTLEMANQEAPRALSLRHWLSMSSGLDDGRYVDFGGGDDALGQYVRERRSLPRMFPPGEHFGYSNAGICTAGHAAATATGKPWEALLQETILRPAGFRRSAVLDSDLLGRCVSAGHYPSPRDTEVIVREATFSQHRAFTASCACALRSNSCTGSGRFGAVWKGFHQRWRSDHRLPDFFGTRHKSNVDASHPGTQSSVWGSVVPWAVYGRRERH